MEFKFPFVVIDTYCKNMLEERQFCFNDAVYFQGFIAGLRSIGDIILTGEQEKYSERKLLY
jgi:hypothetical protein